MRPSSAQLAALGLRDGRNTITFTVHSALQGTQLVSSTVWQFGRATRLVVSDVDGTITKSDVLGQLMPRVGLDWAHGGVTSLYSQITKQGYQMLYLTARGIGMATTTRDYLSSVQQGEHTLPIGPCLLSPSRLIESFTREVIRRKPEEFKIAALCDIRSLWPPTHNPFYAGFGNRESDAVAYLEAGVPQSRILIINPQGEIRHSQKLFAWASYPRLREIAQEMFPPVADAKGDDAVDDAFTAYNFWKMPIGAPPPVLETEAAAAPKAATPDPVPVPTTPVDLTCKEKLPDESWV
jgi:phosphatidate phosphatase LPIN